LGDENGREWKRARIRTAVKRSRFYTAGEEKARKITHGGIEMKDAGGG
jgi:hypothetical protein